MRFLIYLNLLLGGLLILMMFSDLSLYGSLADVLFPFAVFIVAVWTARRRVSKPRSWTTRLMLIPSFVGGGMHIISTLLFCLTLLPAMFAVTEYSDEAILQKARTWLPKFVSVQLEPILEATAIQRLPYIAGGFLCWNEMCFISVQATRMKTHSTCSGITTINW